MTPCQEAAFVVLSSRWLYVVGLVLVAVGATLSLWRAPDVFPVASTWWWSSTGLVLAAWLLVAVAAWAAGCGHEVLLGAAVVSPAGFFVAAGVAGRVAFPSTPPRFWAGVFLIGVIWLLAFARSLSRFAGRRRWLVAAGTLASAPFGSVWVAAQVPLPSQTRPSSAELPPHTEPSAGEASFIEGDVVRVPCGRARLEIRPLLTFKDSSRDGFWPGLSPSPLEGKPPLVGPARRAELHVTRDDIGVTIDAATWLPADVHSHLNSYTEVRVEGLKQAALRFGPTGAARFEVLPFDYPKGRPARFGTVTAAGEWVVAQGADAEKGPFSVLARGPLADAAPLTVTLLEADEPVCELVFFDFAAQADRGLSPTAGEGVAKNVLQFGRPTRPDGPPVLHLSLSESGIGAGRSAVTHARGVYRNRLTARPLAAP